MWCYELQHFTHSGWINLIELCECKKERNRVEKYMQWHVLDACKFLCSRFSVRSFFFLHSLVVVVVFVVVVIASVMSIVCWICVLDHSARLRHTDCLHSSQSFLTIVIIVFVAIRMLVVTDAERCCYCSVTSYVCWLHCWCWFFISHVWLSFAFRCCCCCYQSGWLFFELARLSHIRMLFSYLHMYTL